MDKNLIMKEAQKYASKGMVDKAIEEWNRYLSISLNDGVVYNTIGDLYLKKNARAEALDSFKRAAEIFVKEGFNLKAMAVYKKMIGLDSSMADIFAAIGDLEAKRGLVASANESFIKAAEIYTRQGSAASALDIYQRMADITPANNAVKIKLAEALIQVGRKDEGIARYLEAAAGFQHEGLSNESAAIYGKLSELAPDKPEVVVGAARGLIAQGRSGEAAAKLKPLVGGDFVEPLILLAYGDACLATGMFDDAAKVLTNVLEMEPRNLSARMALANVYIKAGHSDKAAPELNTLAGEYSLAEDWPKMEEALLLLVSMQTGNLEAHQKLHDLFVRRGKAQEAHQELKILGGLYYDSGDLRKALNISERILREEPSDKVAASRAEDIRNKLPAGAAEASEEDMTDTFEIVTDITEDIFDMPASGLQGPSAVENIEAIPFELETFSMEGSGRPPETAISATESNEFVLELSGIDEPFTLDMGDVPTEAVSLETFEIEPQQVSAEEAPSTLVMSTYMGLEDEVFSPEDAPTSGAIPAAILAENLEEADFYARQGLTDEARGLYQQILKLAPGNAEALKGLASLEGITSMAFNVEPLLEGISEAVELPEIASEAEVIELTGLTLTDSDLLAPQLEGTPSEAMTTAEKKPSRFGDENLDSMFNDFRESINQQIQGEDADTHYNLGIAYMEMGLFNEAASEFQISMSAAPFYVSSCIMLANCYQQMGKPDEAVEELKKGVRVPDLKEEDYLSFRYEMGDVYQKHGKKQEALRVFEALEVANAQFRDVAERVASLRNASSSRLEKDRRVSYL